MVGGTVGWVQLVNRDVFLTMCLCHWVATYASESCPDQPVPPIIPFTHPAKHHLSIFHFLPLFISKLFFFSETNHFTPSSSINVQHLSAKLHWRIASRHLAWLKNTAGTTKKGIKWAWFLHHLFLYSCLKETDLKLRVLIADEWRMCSFSPESVGSV